MFGSVQNNHQNSSPQYGYLIPVQANDRRVYNPQVMDQRHYVPQVIQYSHHQPQMSNSPHKRNTSMSRSLMPQNTPIMLNNVTSSQYLMPSNSLMIRSNAPTFNSHVPVDYKRMFNGVHQTNESGSRHAPISQMPSTFAMASNSILKRSEMTGNPLTSTLGDYSGLSSQYHQNQYQGNKTYSRPQQEDHSPYNNIQRTSVSHTTLPNIHHSSPTKTDRDRDRETDRIRKPSVLENHQGYYRNQARQYDTLDTVEEVSHRGGSHRPERVLIQQRSSQDLNPHHHHHQQQRRQDPYAHLSHANRNEGVPAYRQDLRPSTMNNALLRPTTIRITIASPNLTNMGLRGLRSSFESDDAFTDEVFRINDFINQMFGRSTEGETNWVSAFIQQFLGQLEDTNAKPVGITEDALSKLKTKKFKKKKSKKAKSTDESSTPDENPCAICLVDYEEGDELCYLSCEHDFHKDCITAWLKKKAECPTCRKAIE